jgi:mycothiol synthase
MSLNQIIFRPFSSSDDIPRLLRLRCAVEAEDHSGDQVTEESLRTQLALPGHDPARDRTVALDPADPDNVIGYNLVWLQPGEQTAQANVIVHPAWRHQGIGSVLLEQALTRASQLGAAQAVIYAHQKHPAAGAFLRKHGFQPAGAYTEMRAPGDGRLPPTVWPYGYQVRTYAEVQDLAILTQVFNECYQDLPGHHQVNQEQMAGYLAEFDPQGLFLVFSEKNRPVGVSRVEMSPERNTKNGVPTGYIDSPGIYSPHRRLDLYRALLLTGMKWLQSQGAALIELESWGDKQEVLRSYADLGFTILRQVVTYRRTLTDQPEPLTLIP